MRYVKCKAIQRSGVGNGKPKYIPFWELTAVETRQCGIAYEHPKCLGLIYGDLIDCVWDMIDREIVFANIIDVYPKDNDIKFKPKTDVLVEIDSKTMKFDYINEIIYENYVSRIYNISENKHLYKYLSDDDIDNLKVNEIIEIREWKPKYVMRSGVVIEYDYLIKNIKK